MSKSSNPSDLSLIVPLVREHPYAFTLEYSLTKWKLLFVGKEMALFPYSDQSFHSSLGRTVYGYDQDIVKYGCMLVWLSLYLLVNMVHQFSFDDQLHMQMSQVTSAIFLSLLIGCTFRHIYHVNSSQRMYLYTTMLKLLNLYLFHVISLGLLCIYIEYVIADSFDQNGFYFHHFGPLDALFVLVCRLVLMWTCLELGARHVILAIQLSTDYVRYHRSKSITRRLHQCTSVV